MTRRHRIILAAALTVSPVALLAVPSVTADARTPAPAISATPNPVYASQYATPVPLPIPVRPVPITVWRPPTI